MRTRIVALCGTTILSLTSAAQDSFKSQDPELNIALSEVLVTGESPGPALWKVSKSTDAISTDKREHVLWILGGPGPIPGVIKWRSGEVERVIAGSQEIIGDGSLGITFEDKVGMLKMLTLLPSVLKARKNPDGKRLQDIVSSELYERWLIQKAKYLGRDSGIEKWRPTFAADKLKDEAQKKAGVTLSNSVWAVINRVAKENKIKITSPGITAKIPNDKIKPALKQFLKTPLADVECFAVTVAMVEGFADADFVRKRALAWATGDLVALRNLPAFPDARPYCQAALMHSEVLRDLHLEGIDDLPTKVEEAWLEAIDAALTKNKSTFAVVPISELLDFNGRLSILRAKGYVIVEPQQLN
jgi:hypothetical protein